MNVSPRPASPYIKHVFLCLHERAPGGKRPSGCGACGGHLLHQRLLQLIRIHGLKGKVRINKSHCLNACELGPALVIYPDNLWYVGITLEELDAIFRVSIAADGFIPEKVATAETWRHLQQLRIQQEPS